MSESMTDQCTATHLPVTGVPLIRCELPAGHAEAHQGSSHATFAKWANEEQAARMRAYVADDPQLDRKSRR